MRIKSYFSRTVEDAMALASQELGPDAILVNSRKAPAEARHLGEYEVVFATESGELPGALGSAVSAAPPVMANSAPDRLSMEVADLKRELEGMRRMLLRTAIPPAAWMGGSTDVPDAYANLIATDVPAELAREIVQAAERRAQTLRPGFSGPATFQKALVDELGSRVSTEGTIGCGEGHPRIAALVGPPGGR